MRSFLHFNLNLILYSLELIKRIYKHECCYHNIAYSRHKDTFIFRVDRRIIYT